MITSAEIKSKLPTYVVDSTFLRICDNRYLLSTIRKIGIDSKYYMGLDDLPGIYNFSLVINNDKIFLPGLTAHCEIKGERDAIRNVLDVYIKDLKTAIKF